MKRLLLAVAVFLFATATPTFAGYIIIRVLLEGSSTGPGSEGVPGGPGVIDPGGKPMGGAKGPPPGPGGMAIGPGGAGVGLGAAERDPTRSIVVVIPLETDFLQKPLDATKNFHEENNPRFYKFDVQYYGQKQSGSLFIDSSSIQLYNQLLSTPELKKTRGTELREAYQAWERGKNDPKLLYNAMVLALQSGFAKQAVAYADELMTVAAGKPPAITDRDVKSFVTAWGTMQKAVTGPATQSSDAEDWKVRLDYKNVRTVGHYAVAYVDNPGSEVDRRITQLNDNFAAFYLWHATRGVVLPVPNKPLVTILAPHGGAMRGLHQALDGLPMADAFYSPDHNLLVLSPERMDDVGQSFLRQNQQVFVKGLNRDQLLSGQIPKLDGTGEKGSRPEDVARASTLAAVEKLAIDDADIAAVSREGTRQLLYVTGTLPKHVTLPTWLTNGSVNFFTRPRGPAYVTIGDDDKPFMHVAPTTGHGGPNYVLQRYYRDFVSKKELPPDSDRLLENVLGDVYFNGIKNGDDPDPAPKKAKKPVVVVPPPPVPGQPPQPMQPNPGGSPTTDQEDPAVTLRKKQQRLAIKANATSWALYYYLAKQKPDQLRQYVAELNKLPRDLPIDGRTAYAVFVRVFKLSATDDGPADSVALKKFADEWITYIGAVPVVGYDVPLAVPEPPKVDPATEPKQPGGSKDR